MTSTPSVRQRRLGALLREHREHADLLATTVAERLGWSQSKVSRIEGAQRGASVADVAAMLDVYEVADGRRRTELLDLARKARERGWWSAYDDVLGGRAFPAFEADATGIRIWETSLVHGLLQTAGYAAALFRADPLTLDEKDVARRVEVRMARQIVLEREHPVKLDVILDEAVLRARVGGPDVMREQIDKLIVAATRVHVSLRIVPLGVGAHPGRSGAFQIFDFGDEAGPLVYVTGADINAYLDQDDRIDHYSECFGRIAAQAAEPHQSIELLGQLRDQA